MIRRIGQVVICAGLHGSNPFSTASPNLDLVRSGASLAPGWRLRKAPKGVKQISRMGGVGQAPPGAVSAHCFLTPFEAAQRGGVH